MLTLVNDAGPRRDDLEVSKCLLAPLEERVALAVAGELELDVLLERTWRPKVVDLNGVIDDQLGQLQRVHGIGVAAQLHDAVPHRSQVDDGWHTGKVLEQDARRHEGNLSGRTRGPSCETLDIIRGDEPAVLAAEHVLEQDLE